LREYDIILLGGLSGRLDQTIHTLSYLFKLCKTRKRVFAVSGENVGWISNSVGTLRNPRILFIIRPRHCPTRGLLPFGIQSTVLSTTGLRWNLGKSNLRVYSTFLTHFTADQESSFDGLVSTSNHLVPEENQVWIRASNPIWWTAELRST
ncbi:hypothetical protein FB45DRAFT_779341, partial [Roridomyces roridus]